MYLYSPGNKKIIQIPLQEPRYLVDILNSLNISISNIGLILINKEKKIYIDKVLVKTGDKVELYPFFGGG
ncbi:MAG: hypothetical protein PWQ67_2550 [Clostridia bacterium]|jgi:hypothetical protein|nr:hypothetical protein [Clostridia bacterium]MDN5324096.1 hypothetical protein [Clostridia bacterium]